MSNNIQQNLTRLTNATTNIADAITYGGGTTLGRLEGFPNEINTTFTDINETIELLLRKPATITISASSNCTVTLTDGTTTKTIIYSGSDVIVNVNLGTWTITTTIQDITVSDTITVSEYINYDVYLEPNGWYIFRNKVRNGTASSEYPVGTLLYDKWGDNTSTAFRIVSYDQYFDSDLTAQGYTHSVTLLEEYLDENVVYDSREAFIYLTQDLPAGKYYMDYYDSGYSKRTYISFTTTDTVPEGGQIVWYNSTISAFASPASITSLFDVSLTSSYSTPSSSFKSLGSLSTNNSYTGNYGILNAANRAKNKSNNYHQSNVRQMLNATTSSNWWTPQTIFDRPFNTLPEGKLYKLDNNFVNVMVKPEIQVYANNVGEIESLDGTTFTLNQKYTITKDKLFLPSVYEIGISTTTSEGSPMSYYSGKSNSYRIKYLKSSTNTKGYWLLRTPVTTNSYVNSCVYTDGTTTNDTNKTVYAASACVIQ